MYEIRNIISIIVDEVFEIILVLTFDELIFPFELRNIPGCKIMENILSYHIRMDSYPCF